MPRGFLVKRSQHHPAFSYRERRGSDDERGSDSGSELDGPFTSTCYGSPDSGFSLSPGPVSLTTKDRASSWDRENSHTITNSWTTSVVASSFPLALTSCSSSFSSSSASARLTSFSPSSSSSSLSSPSVKSAPCTPNKTTATHGGGGPLSTNTLCNVLANQPSPLTFTAFDTLSLCVKNSNGNSSTTSSISSSNGSNNNSDKARGASPAASDRGHSLSPAPYSPNRKRSGSHTDEKTLTSSAKKAPSPKKLKAARRINFDVDTTSPVSGTIIKELSDSEDEPGKVTVYGDIEPSFNLVEITPEARAELDKIENKLGDYVCQLCKELYEDAFQLAQHRCSRIVHVEYRCPECDKVFNCPANLASHRRWHKPRPGPGSSPSGKASSAASSRSLLPAPHRSQGQRTSTTAPPVVHGTGIVPTATTDPEKLLLTRFVDGKPVLSGSEDQKVGGGEHLSEEAPFSCEICGKRFRRQAYLRKHAQSHSRVKAGIDGATAGSGSGSRSGSLSARPKPCVLCGKALLNENERLKHEAEHKSHLVNNNLVNNNNNNNVNVSPNISSPRFSPTTTTTTTTTTVDNNRPSSVDNHTHHSHNNNHHHHHLAPQQPKGPILATPTLSPKGLIAAITTATPASTTTTTTTTTTSTTLTLPPAAKDLVCSVCSGTCPSKAALEKHLRSHARETFSCKYCDNTFHSSPGLTRHINKCHPTENRQVILLQLPVSRTC